MYNSTEKQKHIHKGDNTTQNVKYRSGAILVWGYFDPGGTGAICRLDDIMRKEHFEEIMTQNLQIIAQKLKLGHRQIFQMDNNCKHITTLVTHCFKVEQSQCFRMAKTRPRSRPINDWWAELKSCVPAKQPTSLPQFPGSYCKNLKKCVQMLSRSYSLNCNSVRERENVRVNE